MSHEHKELNDIIWWQTSDDLKSRYSSEYWNDVELEKHKEWWISDKENSHTQLKRYLKKARLLEDFEIAQKNILASNKINLQIADLAAGIGWTSALLSKMPNVEKVHAVEISRHRLELLFPYAVKMFKGNSEKLERYMGSFYNLGFDNSSMDIVFMSQAFHHSSQPNELLKEIDRVLKPGGKLIMIGENYIGRFKIIIKYIKYIIRNKSLIAKFADLFPSDDETGDHYYRVIDYYSFLEPLGYKINLFSKQKRKTAVIIAEKLVR